ncbi:DUF4233 domain-containing protein [Cryptosporangium aurantiacum]|uniref:DUF4233 domain-containing protein n=1 Tax=Cryptosporangium aurantiacum TaxID=134849 RepID=A0A1M7Q798_9ACTN|nr:DUF4233 domain-containing protein [Cryptosporangium aurantiacum]SHN26362.1 Protein of unknown function [Cryptosporangium aurantiacum]
MTGTDDDVPNTDEEPARPSGLKNPGAAVRGVGAATLGLEFLVLLLAIQPLRTLVPDASGAAAGLAGGLALLCLLAAGLLRYSWAWTATTVLQVLIVVSGVVHWMLGAVGIIFLLVWIYVLNVRKTVLGSAQ